MTNTKRDAKLERISKRPEDLIETLDTSLAAFDAAEVFTGPAVHFHRRAVDVGRGRPVIDLVEDRTFVELVYATLTTWGMNSRSAKLVEFPAFSAGIGRVRAELDELSTARLADLTAKDAAEIGAKLAAMIAKMKLMRGESQIVGGTKALHHLLPDLLPPVDRAYTLRFFGLAATKFDEELALRDLLPAFAAIASDPRFQAMAAKRLASSAGMNTSLTKIIDNAIIGFVITRDGKMAEITALGEEIEGGYSELCRK